MLDNGNTKIVWVYDGDKNYFYGYLLVIRENLQRGTELVSLVR